MKQSNYKSARDALFDLDSMHTRLESVLDLLYAVYEAERHGDIPQELNARAVWSIWDYMSGITRDIGSAIQSGIHAENTEDIVKG